eukprot:CAMPEP_0170444868 /NCGR_PEP_ID=MMETSP0117_2-20130122/48760_1 /TAXON_ID=400756 /ORGANISM="Durinskia baltica, Strain CSIRO CS-38" /LENGTH=79 /DNA_ID=CAMNT_0010705711 /DNA_START=170 /DNA_END=409 /DNA_ORIENTATION=+
MRGLREKAVLSESEAKLPSLPLVAIVALLIPADDDGIHQSAAAHESDGRILPHERFESRSQLFAARDGVLGQALVTEHL